MSVYKDLFWAASLGQDPQDILDQQSAGKLQNLLEADDDTITFIDLAQGTYVFLKNGLFEQISNCYEYSERAKNPPFSEALQTGTGKALLWFIERKNADRFNTLIETARRQESFIEAVRDNLVKVAYNLARKCNLNALSFLVDALEEDAGLSEAVWSGIQAGVGDLFDESKIDQAVSLVRRTVADTRSPQEELWIAARLAAMGLARQGNSGRIEELYKTNENAHIREGLAVGVRDISEEYAKQKKNIEYVELAASLQSNPSLRVEAEKSLTAIIKGIKEFETPQNHVAFARLLKTAHDLSEVAPGWMKAIQDQIDAVETIKDGRSFPMRLASGGPRFDA